MKTKYIEPEDVERLLGVMEWEEQLIVEIAIETGMRIGDILALKSENIDIKKQRIIFTAQKTKKDAKIHISNQLFKKIYPIMHKNPKKWIFPSPRDSSKHLTRQWFWKRVKRACRLSGVDPDGVAPHSFRKVFAVEYFKREGLEATREALQHERASTTQIYALSDFTSGSNGNLPLLRRDLPYIISELLAVLKPKPV